MFRFLTSLLLLLCQFDAAAQQTVGLFQNTAASFDGFTLIGNISSQTTHLIDNCGRVVNSWESAYAAGASCYLLDNGDIIRCGKIESSVFIGGGIGGIVERFSWDGELVWSMEFANDTLHQHHDIAPMPNGNVLVLAWSMRSPETAASVGDIDGEMLWPETVLEIEPIGGDSGAVVWSWNTWDHLVQNVDSTLPNFAEPADSPGRFDVNYTSTGGTVSSGDWQHMNAIDYNPGLDQIMLSSKRWNEIYIIDHSTTTAEASGASGGTAGHGGDLLYRWGNPLTYGRGTDADKLLFGQHNPNWITNETVLLFNNGQNRPDGNYSTADEFTLPLQADGTYLLEDDDVYGPETLDWRYPEIGSDNFFSPRISSAQRLPNGNTLICEGTKGHTFEVTPEGEIVWDYITAQTSDGPMTQGDEVNGNGTFRATRYAADYSAFSGRDLTPGDPVELEPLALACEIYVGLGAEPVEASTVFSVFPNPAADRVTIRSDRPTLPCLRDLSGRIIWRAESAETRHEIGIGNFPAGAYLVSDSEATLAQLLIKY